MVIFFRGNVPLQAFDRVLNASLDWRLQSRGGGGGGGGKRGGGVIMGQGEEIM